MVGGFCVCGDSLWGLAQPVHTQYAQGGADASGPYAATSRLSCGSGGEFASDAYGMPMQLPWSKWFEVLLGWATLDFGRDDGGQVEGKLLRSSDRPTGVG